MGSVCPMFSEDTLMLYQKDLQLGSYFVDKQLAMNRRFPRFSNDYFAE